MITDAGVDPKVSALVYVARSNPTRVTEVNASHAGYISQPALVAQVIETAAENAANRTN